MLPRQVWDARIPGTGCRRGAAGALPAPHDRHPGFRSLNWFHPHRSQGSEPCAQGPERCAQGFEACAQRLEACGQGTEPCAQGKKPRPPPVLPCAQGCRLARKAWSIAAARQKASRARLGGLRAKPEALRPGLGRCAQGEKSCDRKARRVARKAKNLASETLSLAAGSGNPDSRCRSPAPEPRSGNVDPPLYSTGITFLGRERA